jgi:hypothetical protein
MPSVAALKEPSDPILEPIRVQYMGEDVGLVTNDEWFESSILQRHNRLLAALRKKYCFDNPGEIGSFLLTNSFLDSILLEAPQHIHRIFGEVELHLELLFDPDCGTEELFVLVKSHYPISESIKLEEQLFEEWFYEKIDSTLGKLNITEVPA